MLLDNLVKMDKEDFLNFATYEDYIDRLCLLYMSIFEWKGLPASIDMRYFQKTLLRYGQILFFKHKELDFMVAQCTPSGELNYYELPISYTTCSVGLNQTSYNLGECVLIRDNLVSLPAYPTLSLFAHRLANIERTTDVNIEGQQTPLLIQGTDKQMLSLQAIYDKIRRHCLVIFGDKDINRENLKVLKTDVPFVADKLQIQKHQLWNEALTFIGINNSNMDKKERVNETEANSNNINVSAQLQTRLLSYKTACEQIKELYDLDVTVEIRENLLSNNSMEGYNIE